MLKQLVGVRNISLASSKSFTTDSLLRSCLNEPQVEQEDEVKPVTGLSDQPSEALKYGELVLAKMHKKQGRQSEDYTCKMFILQENGILSHRYFSIFHEHIISQSAAVSAKFKSRDQFFRISPFRETVKGIPFIEFKRPTLYEYIRLREHNAVPSHYSILSMVPLLLEIGRRSRILECGTGAGAMSLFLSERLGPAGRLDTFDVLKVKEEKARAKFNEW